MIEGESGLPTLFVPNIPVSAQESLRPEQPLSPRQTGTPGHPNEDIGAGPALVASENLPHPSGAPRLTPRTLLPGAGLCTATGAPRPQDFPEISWEIETRPEQRKLPPWRTSPDPAHRSRVARLPHSV